MADRKKINDGPVVFEEYESEVIAINLDSGAYYSLIGESATLWKHLRTGASVEQLAQHFVAAHDADPAVVSAEVASFLQRLEAESLVVDAAHSDAPATLPPAREPKDKTPFNGFEMNIYTDMQELLLLDPVHDVAESGWPAEAPKAVR